MKDKITAIIRQTWYETAKNNLTAGDRLRFYEMCLEYEYYGNMPDEDAPFGAKLLFDMVKNDIDEDKAKTEARAERARQNGTFGGRPKKSTEDNTDDNNPVGYSKTNEKLIQTQEHKQEQKQTQTQSDTEDAHTFFNVCLLFFESGCSEPVREASTFWHYYESLGWKTKGGGEIVDRLALAKAWRLSDCSKAAMRRRAPYADLMHKANPVEISLIENYVDMIRDNTTQTIKIKFQDQATCLLLDKKYMPALKRWLPTKEDGSYFGLSYLAMQTALD